MNLAAAIKNSDPGAFVRAYDQLHGQTFYFFLKRTKDMETAKELTQITFIKLWQGRNSLSEEYPIGAQSFTIASSVLIDYFRKEAVRRKNVQQFKQDLPSELVVESGHSFETEDYIDAAAETLPPVRKNVFLLKTINGFSNKEVAEELSISVKTVEDHYSKALRHIRTLHLQNIILVLLACEPLLS